MSYRKYNARKKVVDGITFDSTKEANRYIELKLLARAGKISDLRLQVKYTLIPAQYEECSEVYARGEHKGEKKRGKLIERECAYFADFVYMQDGKEVVEDVKGYRDSTAYAVFGIKRKLMLYVHGIQIKES